jgi:hypothetical protein
MWVAALMVRDELDRVIGTWGRRGSRLPLHLAPQVRYLSSGTEANQFQVFPAFLIAACLPKVGGGKEMSDNYRLYAQKMTERRTARDRGPLRGQLDELMRVVRRCEAMWALEDRIERSR